MTVSRNVKSITAYIAEQLRPYDGSYISHINMTPSAPDAIVVTTEAGKLFIIRVEEAREHDLG